MGKVADNADKFTSAQLNILYQHARDLIDKFDYSTSYGPSSSPQSEFIPTNNAKMKTRPKGSILINEADTLLRAKTPRHPQGRLTGPFKTQLRGKVQVVDKNLNRVDQNEIKQVTDLDLAEPELREDQLKGR